jgi:SOS-response transcriptional repressor LexA
MTTHISAEDYAVYACIEEYYSLHGYSPSTLEIMATVGCVSRNTVHHHVHRLVQADWLTKQPHIARSLVPIHYPRVYWISSEGELGI